MKRSPLVRYGLIVVLIGSVFAWAQVWPGIVVWQNRTSATIASLAIVGPLVAALTTEEVVTRRKAGIGVIWAASPARDSRVSSILLQDAPFRCDGARPILCLTADYKPARQEVSQALRLLADRVSGTPLEIDRVELRPRGVLGDSPPSTSSLHVDDLGDGWSGRDLLELLQTRLDPSTPGGPCAHVPIRDPESKVFGPVLVIEAWALGDASLIDSRPDSAQAVARFDGLTASDRADRLTALMPAICSGSLALDDLSCASTAALTVRKLCSCSSR